MAFNYKAGIGSVGSYQVAGIPYITGSGADGLAGDSEHKITFSTVAKSVLIMLHDSTNTEPIRVHFNSRDSGNVYGGNHFYPLSTNRDAVVFNTKCREIYVSNTGSTASGYIVVAELTGIEGNEMFTLTGSGLTD